jgi:putative ABC transport system permease protein
VLLVGAGLMIRSFLKLYTIDIGIRTDHLVAMRLNLPSTKYPPPPAPGTPAAAAVSGRPATDPRIAFYDRLLPRLEAVAGVEAVAFTTSVPPFGGGRRGIDIEGRPARKPEEQAPSVGVVTISPRFFDAVGVPLKRGRMFHDTDGAPGSETTIINEKLAAQFFANEDPIGRRIRFTPNTPAPGQPPPQTPPPVPVWRTIVGISPTIRHSSPQDAEPPAVMYVPHRQNPPSGGSILVRSRLDVGAVMNAVRTEVGAVDPDQPILAAQTMEQMLEQQMWPYRVFGSLFAIFAVIALVMSAVGLYAVMAYSVTQRTTEIGVRMALGAEGRQVSWLILKRGFWQMGLGLTLGLAGAFGLSRVLRTLLVQVTPTDPVTFAAITTILTTVAIAACVIPARRATRVDPLIALRAE